MGHIAYLELTHSVDQKRNKHYLVFEKWIFLNRKNMNPFYLMMLRAKSGWNLSNGSGEKENRVFKFREYIFTFSLSSPLEKGCDPSFEQTNIPVTKGSCVPSLIETDQVILEKKNLIFVNVFSVFRYYFPLN